MQTEHVEHGHSLPLNRWSIVSFGVLLNKLTELTNMKINHKGGPCCLILDNLCTLPMTWHVNCPFCFDESNPLAAWLLFICVRAERLGGELPQRPQVMQDPKSQSRSQPQSSKNNKRWPSSNGSNRIRCENLYSKLFQGARKINRQASAASPSKLLSCRTLAMHLTTWFWSLFLYSPLELMKTRQAYTARKSRLGKCF